MIQLNSSKSDRWLYLPNITGYFWWFWISRSLCKSQFNSKSFKNEILAMLRVAYLVLSSRSRSKYAHATILPCIIITTGHHCLINLFSKMVMFSTRPQRVAKVRSQLVYIKRRGNRPHPEACSWEASLALVLYRILKRRLPHTFADDLQLSPTTIDA